MPSSNLAIVLEATVVSSRGLLPSVPQPGLALKSSTLLQQEGSHSCGSVYLKDTCPFDMKAMCSPAWGPHGLLLLILSVCYDSPTQVCRFRVQDKLSHTMLPSVGWICRVPPG